MIGFFKRGVAELSIARPDEAKDLVIYKHPDSTIPTKAQLTVEQDEVALFFKDGQAVGLIEPGRHTLETDNIPFLSNLMDSFTGGNVLKAEVYFVTTREIPQWHFGGRIGTQMDVQTGLAVETMVHGTYSARVVDPQKLLLGLVGMQSDNDDSFMSWMRELIMKIMKDHVAELLTKQSWPLLQVISGAYTEEIEGEILPKLQSAFENYGLEIIRLGNFTIAASDDDTEELKKLHKDAAYVRMAGGIGGYQQLAGAKAMMGAGEGMAKGGDGDGSGVMAGAGLGVGMGMANMFAGQTNQQAPTQSDNSQVVLPSQVKCGACQAMVAPGKFCSNCGSELTVEAQKKFCSSCGTPLEPDAKFCSSCGQATP